jgi:hypothetical protein
MKHKCIKAMGISDTTSLFRLSASCSKPDVIDAWQRAAREQPQCH